MASFEEYYDDVLEVETEYHIDSEEEDEKEIEESKTIVPATTTGSIHFYNSSM